MNETCSAPFGGHNHPQRGFHTFVMTGDAIIRTNFNPFKPTRQLSLDSHTENKEKPKPDRSISHEEATKTSNDFQDDSDNNQRVIPGSPHNSTHNSTQNKQFIPGFVIVDEEGLGAKTRLTSPDGSVSRGAQAEDSGIDVQLSDDAEDEATSRVPENTSKSTQQSNDNDGSDNPTHNNTQTLNDEFNNLMAESAVVVDEASAKRLATRLYQLDGFKLSDVSHYLSKSDIFTQKVVDEFLQFFDFTREGFSESLRAFLNQVSLGGSTEEKEKVLLFFVRRYLQCNEGQDMAKTFQSEDACHTLVCALILLNDELHSLSDRGDEKMSRRLFIENLSQLNGGEDYQKTLLSQLYQDIRDEPLKATESNDDPNRRLSDSLNYGVEPLHVEPAKPISSDVSSKRRSYPNPTSVESRQQLRDVELMKGYILKKNCKGPNGIKTLSGKRGWRRQFAIFMDLKLMLFKSDKHLRTRKSNKYLDLDNAYASVASHYTKKKNGFTVTTADGSEYLFIAGTKDMMEDWIYSINLTAACYSTEAQSVEPGTSSHRPSSYVAPLGSPRRMREQSQYYELQVREVGNRLLLNQNELPQKGASSKHIQDFTQSQMIQQHRLQKYTAYMTVLKKHLDRFKPRSDSVTESIAEEPTEMTEHLEPLYLAGSRMSYRLAVYGPH